MAEDKEDVEYIDIDNQLAPRVVFKKPEYSRIATWAINTGIAKNQHDANMMLVALATALFILTSLFIYIGYTYTKNKEGNIPLPENGFTVSQ